MWLRVFGKFPFLQPWMDCSHQIWTLGTHLGNESLKKVSREFLRNSSRVIGFPYSICRPYLDIQTMIKNCKQSYTPLFYSKTRTTSFLP